MAETAQSLKVFVSYSRTDVAFADQLVLALQDKGFEAILDRHDMSGGENWRERLGKLILSADAVAFVLSEKSAASEICAWEVEEAHRLGKRILPVTCGSVLGVTPPKALAELNWIPFYAEPAVPGSGFYYGVKRLMEALSVDLDWLRAQTRYSERATEWAKAKPDDLLLRGEALKEAYGWQARTPSGSMPPDSVREYLATSGDVEQRREAAAKAQVEEREQALKTAEAAVAERQAAIAEKVKTDRRLRLLAVSALTVGVVLVAAALWGLWYAGAKSAEAGERRAEVFAQASDALLQQGNQPMAMLMAIAGDPAAHEGLFPGLFRPDGYSALKAALARAYSSDRLLATATTGVRMTAIAALPDGKRFLTFHDDLQAREWEAGGETPRATFTLPGSVARAIAVADSGGPAAAKDRMLLLINGDQPPVLWNLRSQSIIQEFPLLSSTAVGVSASGSRVITGNNSGTVAIWTVGKPAPDRLIEVPGGPAIWDVLISPDETYFMAADASGGVTTGELDTGEFVRKRVGSDAVTSLAYISQINGVVTGTAGGMFGIHQFAAPDEFTYKPGFISERLDGPGIRRVLLSPDERVLLLVSTNDQGTLVRSDSGETLDQLKGQIGVRDGVFLPAANALATGSEEGVIKTWALGKPEAVFEVGKEADFAISAIAGQAGVFRTSDGAVRRFGEATPIMLQKNGAVEALSPDGSILVSWSGDGLCVLRLASGEACRLISGPAAMAMVRNIVFDPGGQKFLTLRPDAKEADLWTIDAEQPTATLKSDHIGHGYLSDPVALGGDGQYMLITDEAGELVRVSFADGTEQILTKTGRVERVAVSPDGAKIAVGFTDGGVQLWRIGEERPVQVFKGHTQALTSMTFNRGGSLLLTGARDGAARLWRLDERESAQHFEAVESDIEMVGFDEDDGHVLILSNDQIARWPISAVVLANADEQVRMACVRLAALGIDGFAPEDLDRYPILKKAPKDPCLAAGVAKPLANAALPASASGATP